MESFNKEMEQELGKIRAGRYIEMWNKLINSPNYDLAAHIVNIVQVFSIVIKQMELFEADFIYKWIQF